MNLINEVLPKQICELLPNDNVYLIYSYCGNTQYDIVLRQLKNIIDSSIYVIRDQRRKYRNYEMNICKYILSKNNQKMYLNGIVEEFYYNYSNNEIDIFDYLNNFINNHTITTSIIVEELYSDIETETDSDSDDVIPNLA